MGLCDNRLRRGKEVGKRLHIGFDDPSDAAGTPDFIRSEFIRVRNDIKDRFYQFYVSEIKKERL